MIAYLSMNIRITFGDLKCLCNSTPQVDNN